MRATRLTIVVLMLALSLGWEGTLGERAEAASTQRGSSALAAVSNDASLSDLRTPSFWQELRRSAERGRGRFLLLGLVAAGQLVLGLGFLWASIQSPADHPIGAARRTSASRSPPALAAI
jgi:hypothetical protein